MLTLATAPLVGCGSRPEPPPSEPILAPQPEATESAPATDDEGTAPAVSPSDDDEAAPADSEPELIALPPEGGELYHATWSPDGKSLAFCSFVDDQRSQCAHSSLHLYSLTSRKLSTLMSRTAKPDSFHRFERVSWSPDGKRLAVCELVGPYASEGALVGWVVPAAGGKEEQLRGDTELAVWSPDGATLARLRLDESRDESSHFVDCVAAKGSAGVASQILVSPRQFEFIDDLAWAPDGKQLALVASRSAMAVLATVDTGSPGAEPRLVAELGAQFGFGSSMAWGASGNAVCVADGSDLVSIDLGSGETNRQSFPGDLVGFSVDGEVVALLVQDRLCVMVRGDDRPQALLELSETEERPVEAAFSPDLSRLAINAEGKLWLHAFAQG